MNNNYFTQLESLIFRKFHVAHFFLCFILFHRVLTAADGGIHPDKWSDPYYIHLLKKADIISKVPMKEHLIAYEKEASYCGEVYLVALSTGEQAVFKVHDPDELSAQAEVLAYELSQELGFFHVPPIVYRKIDGQFGTLQLFIETSLDVCNYENYSYFLNACDQDSYANLLLYYFVIGQWDTGRHNLLVFDDGEKLIPIAIDNEGISNRQHVQYSEPPYVCIAYSDRFNSDDWNESFPFNRFEVIESNKKSLFEHFGEILPADFYGQIYDQPCFCRYVVYQNRLWRQFHSFDEHFVRSFTDYCPLLTLETLKGLTRSKLKAIFKKAGAKKMAKDFYIPMILERRDQVLDYFNQKISRF